MFLALLLALPLCAAPARLPKLDLRLPPAGSPRFEAMVADAQAQVRDNRTFAVVDLSSYITPELGRRWSEAMPAGASSQITPDGRILQMKDGQLAVTQAGERRLKALGELQEWVTRLTRSVVGPGTEVKTPSTQLRAQRAGDRDPGTRFPEWHVDGGDLNATLALHGAGSEVLGGAQPMEASAYHRYRGEEWQTRLGRRAERSVKRGELLIYMGGAERRGRALELPAVHRTPAGREERVLLVFRFP